MTSIMISPPYPKSAQAPPHVVAKVSSSPWLWMAVACLLLGISGGIRFWREWQFAALAAVNNRSPFPLSDLPRMIGNWESKAGDDGKLDDKVARIAGSKDNMVRTYLDKKNDDKISALAIFGRSDTVFSHSPDVCYPSAGYQLVRGPVDREMTVPGVKGTVRYRWAIYMKRIAGVGLYQETYHTFYFDGEWLADAADRWKSFRYHPSMFRVLLERNISGLSSEAYRPSEELLGEFVKEISERVSRDGAGKAAEATSVSTAPEAGSSKPQVGGPG
jgi:Protein of unknown function (DUF3485)